MGGYIRGQALTCALMAVLTPIVFLNSMRNALALAMFTGAAHISPYARAILAGGPSALTAADRGRPKRLDLGRALFVYQALASRFIRRA